MSARTYHRRGTALWAGLAISMLLVQAKASIAGVQLPSPNLPPEANPPSCAALKSQYEDPDLEDPDLFALYPNGVDLSDVTLSCFENVSLSVGPGPIDETQTFDAVLSGMYDNGSGPQSLTLTGPVSMVAYSKATDTTGTWLVEIVSMDLSGDVGGLPVALRVNPFSPSLGVTTVTDLGGGVFEIDSYVEVFTEISLVGGPWVPQSNSAERIELVGISPPTAVPALGPTGGLVLALLLASAGMTRPRLCFRSSQRLSD